MKQINAVQDESAKKLPPKHIMGSGLRKSPPKLNAATVITKSPTNYVAAAASTLIYQKNYVDSNSGVKGGRTELYDNVLEVNSSTSKNSEDSEDNERNASGSKEDDRYFHLEENESDAASGPEEDKLVAPEGLVCSDDEAYLFKSEDKSRTSFPKEIVRKNVIPGGPPRPDVRNRTEAQAEIVLKAYAKERKAYTDKQHFSRVKALQTMSHLSGYSGPNSTQLQTMTDVESNCLKYGDPESSYCRRGKS